MEETGTVIEVVGDTAKIGIKRKSQCAECEVKSCCLELTSGEMMLEAENEIGAKEGELVKVYLESKAGVTAGMIVYIVPILFFLLGFAGGVLIAKVLGLTATESVGVLAAFIFLVLSYLVINRFYGEGRRSANRFKPVVKEVVGPVSLG